MKLHSYLLYGLRVSANVEMPCPSVPADAFPDVTVRLVQAMSEGDRLFVPQEAGARGAGSPGVHRRFDASRGCYELGYPDGVQFLVAASGDAVVGRTPRGGTLAGTLVYLVGAVMGLVLRLRGVVSLHASAVVVNGAAVCLCGPAGSGKSSTAAAFAMRGHPILTDDVSPLDEIDGAFFVRPAYPRVNLWPDAADALFGGSEPLPRISPDWNKRYVPLEHRFHDRPARLAAIYLLGERRACGEVLVERRSASETLFMLIANAYVNRLLDRQMRGREFEVMARLTRTTPVRFVSAPADLGRIGSLCDVVVADAGRVG